MSTVLPELAPLLAGGPAELPDLPVADLRAMADAGVVAAGSLVRPPVVAVRTEDLTVAGVPVRLYRPVSAPTPAPLHVHLHGGGWWMGSIATADAMCLELAAATGAVVASVDYALAPEHPFPAAFHQCRDVVLELVARAAELGLDADAVSLGGESAGGNLAAAIAPGLPVRRLWLDVPALDLTLPDTESLRLFGTGHGLQVTEVRRIVDWYLAGHDPRDPRVSPALGDLAAYPPTLVTVAELDPLRDQGLAFADALRAAGTEVSTVVAHGHVHGSAWLTALTESAAAWHARVVGFLTTGALVEEVVA